MEPDPLALLADTLKDLESSIESFHGKLQALKHEHAMLVAAIDLTTAHRENLMAIRARLASKLPA